MLIKNNKLITICLIALTLILIVVIGCAGIPCYPPEYYAPEEGAPYVAESVTVSTQAGHELVGTLTIPRNVNQPLPGVALITGSSSQNRDHSPADHPEYRFFRQIADALSRQGIVVLRVVKNISDNWYLSKSSYEITHPTLV